MKPLIFLLGFALMSSPALAVGPGPLPDVHLYDADGSAVSMQSLQGAEKWVLVVIDAGLPAAYDMLHSLSAKEDSRGAGVTLAVIGYEADLLRLRQEFEKLSEARWLLSRDTAVIRDLKLSGIPTMIGVDAGGRVAWQYVGMPETPEQVLMLIRDWLTH